jgi:hypothetical protein
MTPNKQKFSNVKIWRETYSLLLDLQRKLTAHPTQVSIMHEALSLYAKQEAPDIDIPPSPKENQQQEEKA